jgi:hypothetical protein
VCILGPADIKKQFNLREQLVLLVSSTVGDSVSALPGDAATAAIVFVSVKLPELWVDDPETRLAVLAMEYDYMFMKLLHKDRMWARDFVHAAGLFGPYERVKAKLTASHAKSRCRLVFSFLTSQICVTPSFVRANGRPPLPASSPRAPFLRWLPAERCAKVLQDFKNLAELAATANSLQHAKRAQAVLVAVVVWIPSTCCSLPTRKRFRLHPPQAGDSELLAPPP